MRLLLVLNGISHLWDTLEIKLIFPHIRVQYCSLCGVLFSNIFHVKSLPHPPYQQHHTPPPHTITTLRQTPTPINHTCQPPIITTEAAFQELLALNQSKSSHLHHINILQHHLSNHTTPVDLKITTQPWIQLSAQLQEAWDTGIKDCTRTFITTLISHRKRWRH